MRRTIRVMLIGDPSILLNGIEKKIKIDDSFELINILGNITDIVNFISSVNPNIIVLDYEFWKEKSYDYVEEIFLKSGVPTLFLSKKGNSISLNPLKGIVDATFYEDYTKNTLSDIFLKELMIKIKLASAYKQNRIRSTSIEQNKATKIIAIGASTGGVEAISSFIPKIPIGCYGIVIVQHIPPNFSKMFATRLNGLCQIEVAEAKDGDMIETGKALIAPGNMQMKVYKNNDKYFVRVTEGPRINGHAPSVDVLFNSVAEVFRANAMGVILTGMGADGAKGLLEMRKKGAYTIGQNKESSTIYGMPKEAYDLGAVQKQVSLNQVFDEIINFCKK